MRHLPHSRADFSTDCSAIGSAHTCAHSSTYRCAVGDAECGSERGADFSTDCSAIVRADRISRGSTIRGTDSTPHCRP